MTVKEQARRDSTIGVHEMEPPAIAARFLWARRSGHPFWLWPDVTVHDWQLALATIEQVCAALLHRTSTQRIAAANDMQQRAFRVAVHTAGVGPWLGWHIEQGRLDADPALRSLLLEHLAHSRTRAERLAATTRDVAQILHAHTQVVVVLKGIHTAYMVFQEPALRPMADVDILPATGEIVDCERELERNGFAGVSEGRQMRPYRSEWRPPNGGGPLRSLTITHADDPFVIDLHGTLDIDFFGVQTVLFGRPAADLLMPVPAHGDGVSGLRQPLLAAHLAVHASHGLHSLTLIRLIELTLVLRKDVTSKAEWNELAELLRDRKAERFAFPALALVAKLAPGTVPPDVLDRLSASASARQRHIIAALRPASAQRLDKLALDERFMWAATPMEYVRRIVNMLLPTGTGGSARRLVRIYVERAFRIARRRVSVSGGKT